MINIIILIGESASGKSSIERALIEHHNFEKIVSYTTRPPRQDEIDGTDYYFIDDKKFAELLSYNFFAESALYNGWNYGTAKQDCLDDRVLVCTPHGMRQLKKNKDLHIVSFYIKVPRADRLVQAALTRKDIDEVIRRNISDVGQYDGLEDEVDCVISNPGYFKSIRTIAGEISSHIDSRKLNG